MTNDQQSESAQEASFPFRITSHRDGEVIDNEWISIGGVLFALLAYSVVSVMRKEADGTETLIGIGTTIPIPLPDPADPGGPLIVAWTTVKLFLKEGSHRIFARVLPEDDPPVDTAFVNLHLTLPLGNPTFSSPVQNGTYDRDLTVSGSVAAGSTTTGVMVKVYMDLGTSPLGQANVANRRWSMPIRFQPGVQSIVAEAVKGAASTGRVGLVKFYVRPEPVSELKATVSAGGDVTYTGTGYVGAEGEIYDLNNNMEPVLSFPVDNTPWSKTVPDSPPGSYHIGARQSVSDGVGGRIYSVRSNEISYTVEVPTPTLVVKVNPQSLPEFSGEGRIWPEKQTTIRIYIDGMPHPDVPDGEVTTKGDWLITARQAFPPGEYSVTAEQRYNGLASKRTEPQILVIEPSRPAPPEIETVSDDGRVPTISGKGISGARLKLVYSDDSTEHPIEIRNGPWSFQRADKPLAPGLRSVRAWQEVDGLASESVSRDFVVVTPQPEITLPRQDDQVGPDTDVVGSNAVAGAVMKIYDYISEEVLNSAPMTVEHEESGWQVALKNLPFGRRHIFAVQDYEGQSSKPSEPYRSFDVVLQPPQIDSPEAGTHVTSTSVFNGKARAFALIELRLKGAAPEDQIEHVYADEKGEWNIELTLPLGPCSVRAKQSIDDQESVFTEPRSFTVVPRAASIETPADQEPVESQCVISGSADSPGTVTVALSEDLPPLGTVPVKDDGTWSTTVNLENAPAGIHSLITRLSQQGFDSHWSPPRSIVLRKHPPLTATPDQGNWVNNRVMFAGKALPAAVIEVTAWFNPDIDWAPKGTQAGASGDWSVESETDLVPGPNRAIIRQRYVDEGGQEHISEAEVGERFEVIPDNEGSFGIGSSLQVNHSSTATLTGRES
ncbi:hypothetical protein [Pseudomonas sp. KCJK9016]|uniref:hypothetical protein n=1 Tax=Pseudomonas sp. KCJK9016 TaxID=3344556 RepID=UPI003906A8E0